MKRKSITKKYRRIRGFDLNTAEGREAARQYRMVKHRIRQADASPIKAKPNGELGRILCGRWKPEEVCFAIAYSDGN